MAQCGSKLCWAEFQSPECAAVFPPVCPTSSHHSLLLPGYCSPFSLGEVREIWTSEICLRTINC